MDDKLELRVRVALPVIGTWSNYLFRKLFREMTTLKRVCLQPCFNQRQKGENLKLSSLFQAFD